MNERVTEINGDLTSQTANEPSQKENGALNISADGAGAEPLPTENAENHDGKSKAEHPKMRLLETKVFRGPNPYGYRPVILFKIDLGGLEEFPTNRLGDFTNRLLEILPSLHEHGCSYGKPGGFVRRMLEGTWIAHVAEHLALDIQGLVGTPVTYGKTRTADRKPGVYNVVYSYQEERIGMLAGWLALRLINHLLPQELQGIESLDLLQPRNTPPLTSEETPFDFQQELEELTRLAERLALGPTTQSIIDEAHRRDIPTIRLDDKSLVQLGYGKYRKRIRSSVSDNTSHIALETASDKKLTIQMLSDMGLPTPKNTLVRSADEAVKAAEQMGYPVVTKPLDVSHGRGVSLNLMDAEQVRWGYEQAAVYSRSVLVETFLPGSDYRVLVIDGKVIAAAQRVPAHVVGDGTHTIGELIEIINRDPRRGVGHEKVLTRITINEQAERLLDQAGYTLETVLPSGERFFLRSTANMSTGGTAIDVTDVMHPDNVEIARQAALVIGLDIAGIDIIAPDITQSIRETGGGIVEVNAGPGFRMHLQPSEGKRRNVARPVIDMLFPRGTPSRIPIVAITGTNGKTTTSRMVAHILKETGMRVGLTTSTGVYVDGQLYLSGDTTGPKSARMVLRDPTLDAAVLETARGGILREGLGFDRCDVGAVLNVQPDHLGLKGIDTVDEMANIKSLVVEVVRRDGYSVLNADDPLTVKMKRRAEGKVVYFSMCGHENCPAHLLEHIEKGGCAVVLQPSVRGDMIAIHDGDKYYPLMWTHEIPATMQGKAITNVQNALAAAAIAYSMQIPIEQIRKALSTFITTYNDSPGRLNIYDEYPFRVILDYAHNAPAMHLMADLVRKLRPEHKKVIGVLGGTGDRRDQDLIELGSIIGGMVDGLIIKQDADLRGRRSGEAAELLRRGAIEGGLTEDQISTILPELEAVDAALSRAESKDLVIIFASKVSDVWKQITSFKERVGFQEKALH